MAAPGGRIREVGVVGGGIVGLACAGRIAQSGASVLVAGREGPGAGASGVAAGMLAPVTEAEFGEETLLRLNLEGAAAWPAFAAELSERAGIDLEYRQSGALVVAVDPDDVGELRRLNELQTALGLDAGWRSGRGCRRLEPGLSPRIRGGTLAPAAHHVDPRAVVSALREALLAEGGEIRSGVAVEAVEQSGTAVTGVRTGDGPIPADAVVVAAGARRAGPRGAPFPPPPAPEGPVPWAARAAGPA